MTITEAALVLTSLSVVLTVILHLERHIIFPDFSEMYPK